MPSRVSPRDSCGFFFLLTYVVSPWADKWYVGFFFFSIKLKIDPSIIRKISLWYLKF